ncbi:MAG: acetate/propionate family kinase [Bryobacteraceae bacterium]
MRILVFNGGSSSLKASVYEIDGSTVESDPAKPVWKSESAIDSEDAPARLLESLGTEAAIAAVGHRIVNGGKAFVETVRIVPEVKSALADLAESAPQHNRLEMAGIDAAEKFFGAQVPQMAVFDSAFHATLPPAAYTYPGPAAWIEEGIRRFGFHGISHRYVSRRAARLLNRPIEDLKLITCHLGNGCSLAAVNGGRSIDTTMGFTPLEGLMMGTRSGSVDPGILIHLMRRHRYTADDIDRILNRESGLKGLAGSGDMREVIAAVARGDERARLALDVFAHRLSAGIGAMLAALRGLDALVFTGGIGENVPLVREMSCRPFEFLGLHIEPTLNAQGPERDIVTPTSAVRALVIRAEEDWEIAGECRRMLAA